MVGNDKQHVLRLYRQILTLHRKKLEPAMRILGDDYVRDEFKRHKNADKKFVNQFLQEWKQYAQMLEQQEDKFGKHLSSYETSLMNEDQVEKLNTLKDAATKFE